MKKFSIIAAALFLVLSLMGCGMNKSKDNADVDKVEDNVTDQTESDVTDQTESDVTDQTESDVTDQTESDVTTEDGVVNTEENRLEVADEAADRIAQMEEVESANVIVTDQNAYVAVVLQEGIEGTKQVEDKIAEEARAANSDFNNVYVSMNPDFVKQTTDYGNKIRAGEPVEGFFEEFSDTVRRVFPDAH